MENKRYTITQGVIDVLESLPLDIKWHGYDFLKLCSIKLMEHNNYSKPYDATLFRIMRTFKDKYNIVCIDKVKSIYIKKSEVENEEK